MSYLCLRSCPVFHQPSKYLGSANDASRITDVESEYSILLFGHPGDEQAACRLRSRRHACLFSSKHNLRKTNYYNWAHPECYNRPSTRLCVPAIARDQPDSFVTAACPSQTPPDEQPVRIQLPRLGNANDPRGCLRLCKPGRASACLYINSTLVAVQVQVLSTIRSTSPQPRKLNWIRLNREF